VDDIIYSFKKFDYGTLGPCFRTPYFANQTNLKIQDI
jgi:hypothetical protein